jgi:hypothetical protein
MFYTYVFWAASIAFLLSSLALAPTCRSNLFYVQVVSGFLIFVGSKIGRTFLGLE